jgi:hypothetical protein
MEKHLFKKKLPIEKELPKRVDKTLAWLVDSRNKWKDKCLGTKLHLKRQVLATKRARESREEWKLTSVRLEQELIKNMKQMRDLQRQIDELKSKLQEKNIDNIKVKKSNR